MGLIATLATEIGSPQDKSLGAIFFITLLVLLVTSLWSIVKGKLAIDGRQMTVQRSLGQRTRVPWSRIHTIRVFEVERPGLQSPSCKIEIELDDPSDRLPDLPFTPVWNRERPTYEFGEIKVAPDILVDALRETVGSSPLVEEAQHTEEITNQQDG